LSNNSGFTNRWQSVAVSLNFELTNYFKKLNEKPIGEKSFDTCFNLSMEFWKKFDVSQWKEGEAVYGDLIGVNSEVKNKGYAFLLDGCPLYPKASKK